MNELVMFGNGYVGNRLFPDSSPAEVLVFTSFVWDFGDEGALFVPHHGRGAGYQIALKRGHVVAEVGRERGVFCKGQNLSVVLRPGEKEDAVLSEIQEAIRVHGGLGEDVEFLDTREGGNTVLLSLMLPGV